MKVQRRLEGEIQRLTGVLNMTLPAALPKNCELCSFTNTTKNGWSFLAGVDSREPRFAITEEGRIQEKY
jgi:hypothetical protein